MTPCTGFTWMEIKTKLQQLSLNEG